MPDAMKDPKAFLHVPREDLARRPVAERVRDDRSVWVPPDDAQAQRQAGRCMDCGVPFCQSACPLGNRIPSWNVLTAEADWRAAYEQLAATNNFPEFTGRICPAPCESACVAGLVAEPVAIEQVEQALVEHAFRRGWVQPEPPTRETGRQVAVVGSGPAGLACAQQLRRAGHAVTVYERDDRAGGLLRYGVPDFKLEKHLIDRRLALLRAEGIAICCGVEVGTDALPVERLRAEHDAVVLAVGAPAPRDLDVPGRGLDGIHFAWPYLRRHAKGVAGDALDYLPDVTAQGKRVVVLGGGDTASDCIGTAHREGAAAITNVHYRPAPPAARPPEQPWPLAPDTLTVSSSHEEGVRRVWAADTVAFEGEAGRVTGVQVVDVRWTAGADGRRRKTRVHGTARTLPADLVLLAIGYLGPEAHPLLDGLGVAGDDRGRLDAPDETAAAAGRLPYATGVDGVFAAGDSRRGASLVVHAIAEGRECARAVDRHLTGATALPTRGRRGLQG